MAKRKVAVALSDWLLSDIDDYAQRFALSRSAVVQEATAEYLHARRSEEESQAYHREATAALEDMASFARERGATEPENEPSSLELLRALRGGEAER